MENYLLLALLITVFWVAGFLIYAFTSNKQRDIEAEIGEVEAMLKKGEASRDQQRHS